MDGRIRTESISEIDSRNQGDLIRDPIREGKPTRARELSSVQVSSAGESSHHAPSEGTTYRGDGGSVPARELLARTTALRRSGSATPEDTKLRSRMLEQTCQVAFANTQRAELTFVATHVCKRTGLCYSSPQPSCLQT